jgi:hypothetical protein
MSVDDRIAEVFARPLEEFVDARNTLAKELASDGDEVSARRVRALRKPSVAAWAVNHVVAEHRRKITSLLQTGEKLGDAQRKLLKGHRSDELHELMRRERETIAELTDDAATLLESAGHSASAGVKEKIADTLAAMVTMQDVRDAALAGRLEKEARRAGFGIEDAEVADVVAHPRSGPTAAERREMERLERAAEHAADEHERLVKEADDLEERAKAARARAREAEKAARDASKAAEAARRSAGD